LNHPNILRIFGFIDEPLMYCIITELAEGNLFDWLEKNENTITFRQQIQFCKEATLAVNYLHSNNILHRDIKSINFMVINSNIKNNNYR